DLILKFVTISKNRDSETVQLPLLDSVQWMFPVFSNQNTIEKEWNDIVLADKTQNFISATRIACKKIKVLKPTGVTNDRLNPRLIMNMLELVEKFGREEVQAAVLDLLVEDENQTDFKQGSMKEALALTVDFSYKVTENDSASDTEDIWNESFTIMNGSMIKQGENRPPTFSTGFVTPTDHRLMPVNSESLSNAILTGDQPGIIRLLKLFDKDIEDFQILSTDGSIPVPYLTHKKIGYAPVSVFGDGVRRALTLASAVVNCKDGILLIDEIETAVHVRALDKVFTWLVQACRQYNVQLFATTHSLEAVDAIRASYKKLIKTKKETFDSSDMVAYKLLSNGSKTTAKRLSFEYLSEIRDELGLDVR
ncbi:MAG: AAA family ATPase, partial [Tumebacillaceae bacterium]